MARGTVIFIGRHMPISLMIAFADVVVTTHTEVVHRRLQIEVRLSPDIGMACLTVVGCEGRMLYRHQQRRRLGSVRVMACGAIRSFQVVSFVASGEFLVSLVTFRTYLEYCRLGQGWII
jgi:hypothetical protein